MLAVAHTWMHRRSICQTVWMELMANGEVHGPQCDFEAASIITRYCSVALQWHILGHSQPIVRKHCFSKRTWASLNFGIHGGSWNKTHGGYTLHSEMTPNTFSWQFATVYIVVGYLAGGFSVPLDVSLVWESSEISALVAFAGKLWETGCWTGWAFGLIQAGFSYAVEKA